MPTTRARPAPSGWGLLLGLLLSPALAAETYFVRTDGGSASQCSGQADAAYTGSGSACAWNHPFQALPPAGPARLSGGDTLVIADGSYMMGWGAPGAESCDADAMWECHLAAIPSGPDPAHPTRIVGQAWDVGCPSSPELWGTQRSQRVLDLTDSSNVEIACLEITDGSDCIEYHNDSGPSCPACEVRCERDAYPFGDWGGVGIYAEDSTTVRLSDLDVHGLAVAGLHAGRLSDWTLERVRLAANGWTGWDGDLWEDSSNSGNMVLRQVEIAWNGCAESWESDTVRPETCWAQQAGGYGDGLGLADSGGHWVLDRCHVHHNTSDGVDLLYLTPGSSLEIRDLVAEGNAGNQLKTAGPAQVWNTLLVGSCASFSDSPLMVSGDHCRAAGGAYSLALFGGDRVSLINTTITGQGDCLMDGCRDSSCDGSESIVVRNTLFAGSWDWTAENTERSCLYWYGDGIDRDPVDLDFSLVWQVKDDPCPGRDNVCQQDPRLRDPTLNRFDGHLLPGSPAIGAGSVSGAPSHDIEGHPRDTNPDIGAYEFREGSS